MRGLTLAIGLIAYVALKCTSAILDQRMRGQQHSAVRQRRRDQSGEIVDALRLAIVVELIVEEHRCRTRRWDVRDTARLP